MIAPVKRWAEEATPADEATRIAGEWSRAMGPAQGLSASALAQVRAQLGMVPVTGGPWSWVTSTVPTALLFILLGAGGYHWLARANAEAPSPRVAPWSVEPMPTVLPVLHVGPVERAPCEMAVKPKPKRAVAKAVAPPVAAVAPEPVSESDSLLEESRLLGMAMRLLRRELDAKGSLSTLDGYFARFPTGKLERDARSVQLDALLSLDRKEEALKVFDLLAVDNFKGMPRAPELRVVQGELLLREERYPEASVAFDGAVRSAEGSLDLFERALVGRGIARVRSGDRAGGNADLARYLVRFPGGRFVHQAHAEMK
ncbi:MAG: hypothetical protein K1X64_07925 [Myxococcaceae bacterium]|nr:hypothetical protein [Myxococcaceae bacterium]